MVNGVCGGTRFGPLPFEDALAPELCAPGSVNGAGSNGRCPLEFTLELEFLFGPPPGAA